jgi:hypothetical protein
VEEGLLFASFHRPETHAGYYFAYQREPVRMRGGRFTLPACDPEKAVRVSVVNFRKRLGAHVLLDGRRASEEVTVRLQPCGSARLRCVTAEGKPVPGHRLSLHLLLEDDGRGEDYYGFDKALERKVSSDAAGQLALPVLIPGARYRYWEQKDGRPVAREFTAEAGRELDLPDLTVRRP